MPYIPLTLFANNAAGNVTSGGTAAPASGTVETWTVNVTSAFPAVAYGSQSFHVADASAAGASEPVTVQVCPGGTGVQTWTVVRGAEGTVPVAHQGGFSIIQVVTAGDFAAFQYPPWQFPVGAYGAKGDGIQLGDGVMSSGGSVLTSASASFTAADAGKLIIVNIGAQGAQVNPLVTTITGFTNSNTVTLGATCGVTGTTAAPFIYGTDDAPAINAAINAAYSFGTTYNQKAQVVFEPLNYMLGALTQTTAPNKYNTHIPIPFTGQYAEKFVLDLVGVGDASEPDYWETSVPSLSGTCLVSASFMSTVSATFGQQSIIGGPTDNTGLSPGNVANVLVNIIGITIVAPFNAGQIGYDFRQLAQANLPNASYLPFAGVNYSGQAISGPALGSGIVTNGNSVGLIMPLPGNNDNCNIGFFTAEGAAVGISVSEHTTAQRLALIYCGTGINVFGAGGAAVHGVTILYASVEASGTALAAGAGLLQSPIFIGLLDTEVIATSDITDTANGLTGVVYWADFERTTMNVTGAAGLTIVNTRLPPGPWSGAPAAPGTAVTQRNTAYRAATIYLSATTGITAVTVGPAAGTQTTTGLAAGSAVTTQVRVPSGHWYSVTYTGTLTAKWVLE